MKSSSVVKLCCFALLSTNTWLSATAWANNNTLEQAQAIEKNITSTAAKGQKTIDASSEKSRILEAEIEVLQAEVKGLEVYQHHLEGMIESQVSEISSFDEQLSEIESTRKSIVPLMYSMLEGLESHIAQDRPIRINARTQRVEKLNAMMTQADISDAEKYRRILEAYQIELDYGTKLGSYSGMISMDGKLIETEQLYLGRISLVARSSDRQHYWTWNDAKNSWTVLDSQAGLDIDKAFSIANKQAAPALLNLPVSLSYVSETKENK